MAFKIYTKTGDKGQTGLFGGERLPKDDTRIEAYGTVDELNSYLGLIADKSATLNVDHRLREVQAVLFDIGSHLASQPSKVDQLPVLDEALVKRLEALIDTMDMELEPLKTFILPGGHELVSHCHVARTICRRAERRVITLGRQSEIHSIIVPFLNRLSDYLFTLARYFSLRLEVMEISWTPGKHQL